MSLYFQKIKTPIGKLYVVSNVKNLQAIIFEQHWFKFKQDISKMQKLETPLIKKAMKQLTEYFQGKRRTFDIPYDLNGTDFQNRTWESLAKIPYGETRSYKDQAKLVKSPKAVRAVGRTNGLNPLCIILPCHRVIGSNNNLTGYAGGLKAKRFLLKLEGVTLS